MHVYVYINISIYQEYKFGTFGFFMLSVWCVLLCGTLYVLISW
jgi:hypothetical protein